MLHAVAMLGKEPKPHAVLCHADKNSVRCDLCGKEDRKVTNLCAKWKELYYRNFSWLQYIVMIE